MVSKKKVLMVHYTVDNLEKPIGSVACGARSAKRRSDQMTEVTCRLCHAQYARPTKVKKEPPKQLIISCRKGWNLKTLRREIIFQCLKDHNWHRTKTAIALGVSYRTLTHNLQKMRAMGYIISDNIEI